MGATARLPIALALALAVSSPQLTTAQLAPEQLTTAQLAPEQLNGAVGPRDELTELAPALVREFEGRPVGARWRRGALGQAAAVSVAAPTARQRFGRSGAGATVCVVDTGLDLAHRDFLDVAGRTRVRWLLDRGAPTRGVHGELEAAHGGAVWSAADIDDARDTASPMPRDTHGHGTAVASLAVGDDADVGEDEAGVDAGVAPEASLVIARLPVVGGFADEDVLAGVRFCLAVAGRGPEPTEALRTVIVLGLGGHDGAHDGTEPLERELTRLAGEGALIVVAAGNGGDEAEHAAAGLRPGRGVELPFFVPPVLGPGGPASLSLVVVGASSSLWSVALEAPGGAELSVAAGGSEAMLHEGGRLTVDASRGAELGSRRVYAVVSGGEAGAAELAAGVYTLRVTNEGTESLAIDTWIVAAELGGTLGRPAFVGEFATTEGTVTVPATARGVVSVGASVTSDALVAELSTLPGDGPAGTVAPWSARGPDRRGAPLPSLVAPGGWSVAALSTDVDSSASAFGLPTVLAARRVGASRVAVRGTSFAAPLVAGALALALEAEASRGADDVALLLATATGQAASWSSSAGAGGLSVPGLLTARGDGLVVPGGTGPMVSATVPRLATGRETAWLALRWLDAMGRPALGDVVIEGSLASTRLRVPGYAMVEVPLLEGRAATLDVSAEGRTVARVRFTGRGEGCAAGGAPGLPGLGPLWGVALLFGARRRAWPR